MEFISGELGGREEPTLEMAPKTKNVAGNFVFMNLGTYWMSLQSSGTYLICILNIWS